MVCHLIAKCFTTLSYASKLFLWHPSRLMFEWCEYLMLEYKWVYCYKSMSMECTLDRFREDVNCATMGDELNRKCAYTYGTQWVRTRLIGMHLKMRWMGYLNAFHGIPFMREPFENPLRTKTLKSNRTNGFALHLLWKTIKMPKLKMHLK